jgi:two-component system, OmpR family, alkaline phosphatase synthesis response regulator PhoP
LSASPETYESPLRVLVADDEPPIRLLCQVNLAVAGMEVLQAADGEEALALARSDKPDLVLLDLMMPNVDGWTVAQELAADECTRDIPIVFLTARATTSDRRRAEKLGALGYVLKPFDPVRLAPLVASVVARCSRGEAEDLRHERPPELWPPDLDE